MVSNFPTMRHYFSCKNMASRRVGSHQGNFTSGSLWVRRSTSMSQPRRGHTLRAVCSPIRWMSWCANTSGPLCSEHMATVWRHFIPIVTKCKTCMASRRHYTAVLLAHGSRPKKSIKSLGYAWIRRQQLLPVHVCFLCQSIRECWRIAEVCWRAPLV